MVSLGKLAISGVLWNFLEMLARRGMVAATTVLLSYLVAPKDFGILSMMMLIMVLANGVVDCGLKEALVRRKFLSHRLLNTAFWATLLLGCIVYFILVAFSHVIATIFDQQRLEDLIRFAGVAVVFNALQTIPLVRLTHALDFKAMLAVTLPSAFLSSLIAVVCAYAGFGVVALALQIVVAALVSSFSLWRKAGWSPSGKIKFRLLVSLYRFGYKVFLSTLVALAVKNAVPSLIGKYIGVAFSGYYYFCDKIMELLMGQLVYSVQNVTYSSFSKISTNKPRFLESCRQANVMTVFLISPILMIGAAMSDFIFGAFFSIHWQPAADVFRLLCFSYLLYPLHAVNLNILKVSGCSGVLLGLEVFKAAFVLIFIGFSLRWGLEGVLYGQIFISVLLYFPNAMYAESIVGYGMRAQFRDVAPYYFCAFGAGGVAFLLSAFSSMGKGFVLLLGAAVGVVFYLFLCRIFSLKATVLIYGALRAIGGPKL